MITYSCYTTKYSTIFTVLYHLSIYLSIYKGLTCTFRASCYGERYYTVFTLLIKFISSTPLQLCRILRNFSFGGKAFGHGAASRRIDPTTGHIELYLVPASAQQLMYNGIGWCYSVSGIVHTRIIGVNGKSNTVTAVGFVPRYLQGAKYVPMPCK